MTHTLAIARREIEERLFVVVAAFAAALIPFVVLFAPHTGSSDRKGAIVAIGFLVAVGFTWGLALVLGATLVGREVSEKRLSFYFSRPLSGASIWFGKLIGATALLVVSFAIVNAIPLGLGAHEWQTMSIPSRTTTAVGMFAIAFVLMLVAHIVSTWARSRSALVALDFVALLLFVAFCVSANVAAPKRLAVMTAALIAALVGAGAWQVSRGRTDARRNHRELSSFLWPALAVVLLIGSLFS